MRENDIFMLEVFLKVMDKIHIKEIAFSVLVVCGIILFAPDVFMEKLGLFLWRDKYRSMVGLIFLFNMLCHLDIYIFKESSDADRALELACKKNRNKIFKKHNIIRRKRLLNNALL